MSEIGTLYIVATPIGNRDDMSQRAIQVLQSVDKILAEDTRHSKQLLLPLGISTALISLHAHNEATRTDQIIDELLQGLSFALISDAGTPLISDPGFPLVRKARLHNIPVVPIPGPCALITALSASGLPCDTFTFIGFLPAKSVARSKTLMTIAKHEHTVVFYESTHRIKESLIDMIDVLGENRALTLAKELTKSFETIISGTCKSILEWLNADSGHCKGEFVLMLPPMVETISTFQHEHLLSVLLSELPLKQAVKIAGELTGDSKNELYEWALRIKGNVSG